jgi:hypothetical protein
MNTDPMPGRDAEHWRRDRVIIAASVAALFGRRVAIRQIRAVPGNGAGAWLREGRLAIQTSHRMGAPLIRLAADRAPGDT